MNDDPRANCAGMETLYDELVDVATPSDSVIRRATMTCNACPLQVTCWTENADEEWLWKLRAAHKPKGTRSVCERDDCDNPHRAHGLCQTHYQRALRKRNNYAV